MFVLDERFVYHVMSSGLTTLSGHFVLTSPMDVPAMKIIVLNVPAFVPSEQLVSVLSHCRTIISKISMNPPGAAMTK